MNRLKDGTEGTLTLVGYWEVRYFYLRPIYGLLKCKVNANEFHKSKTKNYFFFILVHQ